MTVKTYTGAARLAYCFLCLQASRLREVVETLRTGKVTTGWECPRRGCGGVSAQPYQGCPEGKIGCKEHIPLR